MTDHLARLAALPGVAESVAAGTRAVDAVLWDRALRPRAAAIAAESLLRGGRDSAALEGAEVPLDLLRDGELERSPLGAAVSASLRVTAEVPGLTDTLGRAPAQALARLAALASAGFVSDDLVGRPRPDTTADDPLHLGPPPPPGEVAARLDTLLRLLVAPTEAPALVVASVAHGEVLALRPFAWGSGLVARSMLRLVIAARGLDPGGQTVPEAGLLAVGRPAYVRGIQGFMSGTREGLAEWIDLNCRAVAEGSRAAV